MYPPPPPRQALWLPRLPCIYDTPSLSKLRARAISFVFLDACPLGERRVEDLVQLFEGARPSLHIEEVDERRLEGVPDDVEEVEPPGNYILMSAATTESGCGSERRDIKIRGKGGNTISQPNRRHILIKERGDVDPKVVKRHSLRARFKRQTLDRVQCLEGREADAKRQSEQVNHRDGRVRRGFVIAICVLCGQRRDDGEPQDEQTRGGKEHLTPADLVDEE